MIVGPLVGQAPEGTPEPALVVPIAYRGDTVAGSWLGSEPPRASTPTSTRVAALLAPYCLVGWDTGGEEWNPEPRGLDAVLHLRARRLSAPASPPRWSSAIWRARPAGSSMPGI